MFSFEALVGIAVVMIIVYIYFKGQHKKKRARTKEGFTSDLDQSNLPPAACGKSSSNCNAPGHCEYSTSSAPGGGAAAGSGFGQQKPCHSDSDCMGQGSCIGGKETSTKYCPAFAGFPYLLKNCQEGAWYCYAEPDGNRVEGGAAQACNYNGSLPAPDTHWGFNENIKNCPTDDGGCCDNPPHQIKNSCATFQCPPGKPLKSDYLDLSCPKGGCSIESCCGPNPQCDTFKCPSNFYVERTLKSNAKDITCGGSRCTAYECCDGENTGRLPEINIWPIYKGQV